MRAAAVLGVGLVAAAPVMAGGCGDSYSALFDSLPIALTRAIRFAPGAVLRFVAHTAKRSLAFPDQERRKRSAARITHLHS